MSSGFLFQSQATLAERYGLLDQDDMTHRRFRCILYLSPEMQEVDEIFFMKLEIVSFSRCIFTAVMSGGYRFSPLLLCVHTAAKVHNRT